MMGKSHCPYCEAANGADAVRCTRCGRAIVSEPAAVALPVTGPVKRRAIAPLREPMEERLLWALALALVTFLGIASLANLPSAAGRIAGGALLPLLPAGLVYRTSRCDMFARRRARVARGSARPGMLIVWGWVFTLLLVVPGWTPGTMPDARLALLGACSAGLLVLDEWRGLAMLAACTAAFAAVRLMSEQLAPGLLASTWAPALLALMLWFVAVWTSETFRKPD